MPSMGLAQRLQFRPRCNNKPYLEGHLDMKYSFRNLVGAGVLAATALSSSMAYAAETIKVGVLHSLSGTMAISETTLKDTVLMMIDEQNKAGA